MDDEDEYAESGDFNINAEYDRKTATYKNKWLNNQKTKQSGLNDGSIPLLGEE